MAAAIANLCPSSKNLFQSNSKSMEDKLDFARCLQSGSTQASLTLTECFDHEMKCWTLGIGFIVVICLNANFFDITWLIRIGPRNWTEAIDI